MLHEKHLRTTAVVLTTLFCTATAAHAMLLKQEDQVYRCINDGAVLVIDRDHWRVALADHDGKVACRDAAPIAFRFGEQWVDVLHAESPTVANGVVTLRVALGNGATATARISDFGRSGFRILIRPEGLRASGVRGAVVLQPVEEVYGFGEMWNGHVAQRGQAFRLWDRGGTPDECAYMPYYVSTANYAWFLNYGGPVTIDAGRRRADQLTFDAPADELDLTLMCGSSIADVVRNFLSEVGLPQRPPRWAFQPWFWLMGDPARPGAPIGTLRGQHLLHMVQQLRQLSFPVGVTWFEPPWQDARISFQPNSAFAPDLKALVTQLNQEGVRVLAWTAPYTTPAAANWKDAITNNYLVAPPAGARAKKAVISQSGELVGTQYNAIDFFNPKAFAWWQQQINGALDLGFRGFKPDAGQDLQADTIVHGGRIGRDVHNSYAREYNRVFFETLKQRYGDDFLMVPRAAWVGSSALTNFKWPGDLAGTFGNNGLPSSVYSSLSLAFCGLPFVSTDIGGFDDKPAPERVWLRWAQFGAMLPGMQTLHMPWWYSAQASQHFRYLTWLHTDLTPLWMTLAHEAAETGAPVCRPLVWSFQDDIDCWRVDDEFTVGTSLLVAPIINSTPMRDVYLPPGVWLDFWDDQKSFKGPRNVTWSKGATTVDKFPLYIREGAILPLEVSNDFSGFGWSESAGFVTLAIWPKRVGSSEFTLHDTEGEVLIRVAREANRLTFSWGPTHRNHLLRVSVPASERPTGVTVDGRAIAEYASVAQFRGGGEAWCFDAPANCLWIRKFNHGTETAVVVALSSP